MDILTLILLFLVIEIFVAFIFYPLKHGRSYYKLIVDWSGFIYRFDPDVGYVHKANIVHQKPIKINAKAPRLIMNRDIRTDKNGFIFTEDLNLLNRDCKLIFCIGGSTTEGTSSPYNQTYPAVIDSLVKDRGYRCVNAGVGGYRSIHELLFFKKVILPWRPWGIIIFSGYNDFEGSAYGFRKAYNPFEHSFSHSLPTNYLEIFLNHSALFHFSKRLIYRLSGNIRLETIPVVKKERLKEALVKTEWLCEWKDNISKIINLCKENDIKCYLISHASPVYEGVSEEAKAFSETDLNMNGRFDIFIEYLKLIHYNTNNLCDTTGAKFIDISSDFDRYCLDDRGQMQYKKRFLLFVDRMHFTSEGNELLAKSIYRKIKEDL